MTHKWKQDIYLGFVNMRLEVRDPQNVHTVYIALYTHTCVCARIYSHTHFSQKKKFK